MERDPIKMLRNDLEAAGELTEKDWASIQQDVDAEVEAAVAFAEAGTPEPVEDLARFVYSERSPE
jgi:TPP-dependent pyruvate/acetoin dehydrogenase alpha subunit